MSIVNIVKKQIPKALDYIKDDRKYFTSNENSHKGLIVPEVVLTYGKSKKTIFEVLPKARKCIVEMKKSCNDILKYPTTDKIFINMDDLVELEDYIKSLGIEQIAYTTVDDNYIFTGNRILYNKAIVITMEMKRDSIDLAPSKKTNTEIFRTYYELGRAVNLISDYLRNKGFNAQAGPALGGDVNYTLLAEKAGLGVIGHHGMLITKEFGPSLRIAAIYTDIGNLPIDDTNEHLWIRDFCKTCKRCVKECLGSAIYDEAIMFSDGSRQCIDFKKCAVPFASLYGCTVCIKECMFYKSDYMTIKSKK